MVYVPAGEFLMGSDEVDAEGKQKEFGFREPMYLDEHPGGEGEKDLFAHTKQSADGIVDAIFFFEDEPSGSLITLSKRFIISLM